MWGPIQVNTTSYAFTVLGNLAVSLSNVLSGTVQLNVGLSNLLSGTVQRI